MSQNIRVGVEFSERGLRYAAVRLDVEGERLLKLGRVDFSFDLGASFVTPSFVAEREAITRALGEILSGLEAGIVRAALRVPLARTFFSRADARVDVLRRARDEAELLGFCAEGDDSVVSADAVRTDSGSSRLHVSVTRGIVLDLLGQVMDPLGCGQVQAVSALRSVAEVIRRLPWATGMRDARLLAFGRFEHGDEVLVMDARGWRFAARVPVSSTEVAGQVQELLRAAGEPEVDTVLTYGEPCSPAWLAALRTSGVSDLDPLALIGHDPSALHADEPSGRYATALGAGLLP